MDGAVVVNIDLRAGFSDDLLDHGAALANDLADLIHVDLHSEHLGCEFGDMVARFGDAGDHDLIQDLQAAKNGKLLWSEDIVELNKQIADIACQERLLAQLKQQAVVDPDIFIFQSNQLAEQRREAKLKKSRILRSEDDQTVQRTQELLDILEDGPDLLTTFDEALFSELVETITIQDNSTIRFRLINGLELPEHIERKK